MNNLGASLKKWETTAVDISKEIENEEKTNALISKEIDHFFERNYHNLNALTDYLRSLIFGQDEELGTAKEIEAIVEYVVGPTAKWCSDRIEVREFRRVIEKSYYDEWGEFQSIHPDCNENEALRSLPQTFCLPPLQSVQLNMLIRLSASKKAGGTVLSRLWYTDLAGCSSSVLREFSFNMTADEAIALAMQRLSSSAAAKAKRERGGNALFFFRVKGRNEYIYGDEKLINFRYIRESVTRQTEINLFIEPTDAFRISSPIFRPSYISQALPNKRHKELCNPAAPQTSLWDIADHVSVKIIGGFENFTLSAERMKEENIRASEGVYLAMLVEIYFGTTQCCAPQMTEWKHKRQFKNADSTEVIERTLWEDDGILTFDLLLANVPRELKFCFTLLVVSAENYKSVCNLSLSDVVKRAEEGVRKGDDQPGTVFYGGTASAQLFDYKAQMVTGVEHVGLWNESTKANPIGRSSNPDSEACVFLLELPTFKKAVVLPSGRPPKRMEEEAKRAFAAREMALPKHLIGNEVEQLRLLKNALAYDPLVELSTDERTVIWKYRETLVNRPDALAKFLIAVDWMQPFDVYEAHCLIKRWFPLEAFDALELLDARYADTVVREQAIQFMDTMTDYELRGCTLQLVQVLKYEPYYYSALGRFLLRRSLACNHIIGHYVFWYLAAEVENSNTCERHGLLLEEFLKRSPLRRNYLRQVYVNRELLCCALQVKNVAKKDRVSCLREQLALIRFPTRFTLPLNPAIECNAIEINNCKVMDSKKFPLWLVFQNYLDQKERSFVIFKFGDDLRQDLLTLQLLELMDSTWKANGLDLHIIPYGCISTGEGVGMIEVVLNSETIASITKHDGGAQAAFSEEPLIRWLRRYNNEKSEVERCLWNFVLSVAGYTVATYILGIGDRHNDNIMLRQDGTLFHIDFGHFLGNFKTKFGFKRETAPFIFTPMYLYTMGGSASPIYQYFCAIACKAYNIARRHYNSLIMLFMLMLSTGIPELQTKTDIEWLRSVLLIGKTEEEAKAHYTALINDAVTNIRTLINDYIHILAH